MKVGPGTEAGVEIGPMINAAAVEKIERHVEDALAKGATVLAPRRGAQARQYAAPMVLTGATTEMVLASARRPSARSHRSSASRPRRRRSRIANGTPFGLAAYFFTENLRRAWRVGEALEFGMVGLNTGAISTEVAPFGGVKQSGLGREGAQLGSRSISNSRPSTSAGSEPYPSRRV